MGIPSIEGTDDKDTSHSGHYYCGFTYWKASDAGFWHGPMTPARQAEFLDGFYRVMMGKPFVEAITYWDFSDGTGHFFPHAGMLDENHDPKDSFHAIVNLRKHIGI